MYKYKRHFNGMPRRTVRSVEAFAERVDRGCTKHVHNAVHDHREERAVLWSSRLAAHEITAPKPNNDVTTFFCTCACICFPVEEALDGHLSATARSRGVLQEYVTTTI